MVHKYSDPANYLTYAQNVILHSTWQWVLPTLAQQQAASIKWAASKGCNQTTTAAVLACMRALPAKSIVSTSGLVNYFQPSVDGVFLTSQPYNLIKNGDYNTDVNIVIGYNADEGNYMAFTRNGFRGPTAALTQADYIKSVYTTSLSYWLTSAQMDGIFNWYAGNTANVGYWYGSGQILGDFYINCGTTLAAPYFAKHGSSVYAFLWNYTSPNYPDQFLQAAHGNELPYIFNATVYTPYAFAPSDYALAARMIAAWSRIADKGKPDPYVWPRYSQASPMAFLWEQVGASLDPPTTTVPFFESNLCSNWEPIFSANSVVQP
mgnify:FL=1